MTEPAQRKDFFVSYTRADRAWAEWIASRLEEAGYTTVVQAWDFRPGENFVLDMHRATKETERTLLVLSPDYFDSIYTQPEWAARFKADPTGELGALLPIRVRDCLPDGLLGTIHYVDLVGLSEDDALRALLHGAKLERAKPLGPRPFPGTPRAFPGITATTARLELSVGRLPPTGKHLFGREGRLRQLDAAWGDQHTNVVVLVAFGGVGKTALISHWGAELGVDGWRGAERVFEWSFYSQGTNDREASADQFLQETLSFCGDQNPTAGSSWDRGERLARLLRQSRTLLLLDGVEPLQRPPGEEEGRLKDPGLTALLRGLAAQNTGLCIVSTRVPVTDLEPFEGRTVQVIALEDLSPVAGAELLRAQGVKGPQEVLEEAATEFGGHALALTLLGSYLAAACEGDVQRRHEIGPLETEEVKGGHARRVMASYEKWFGEGSERTVLHLLGLFNRPADAAAVAALRRLPTILGLTESLQGLSDLAWNKALSRLRRAGLLAHFDPVAPGALDAHPLVREHFGEKLKGEDSRAWRAAHGRLFEHYQAAAPKEYPDTLEEMMPLYHAVAHGCAAGRYQEALEVYWARIQRTQELFAYKKLGASGADLAVLAGFFDPPWRRPVNDLTETGRAYLLNEAGLRLRSLGRLMEAVEPMRAGLEAQEAQSEWRNAAQAANNLSELQLALGWCNEALDSAHRSVKLADRSGDEIQRMFTRTTLADTLHQLGRRAKAESLFREAETLQKEWQAPYPLLYSVQGFQYCDLLLDRGEWQEVKHRADQTLAWIIRQQWLLDIALDHLSLGRASVLSSHEQGPDDLRSAAEHLGEAVAGLRRAGAFDHLPRSLLARAELFLKTGDLVRARDDLEETQVLATRCGMRLFEADAHLGFTRLHLAEGHRDEARASLNKARTLIEATGYHRRDAVLAQLEAALAA